MNRNAVLLLGIAIVSGTTSAWSQTSPGPYHLVKTIALPGVQGGFDHFAYDAALHRLYLAASDNGTLEVMDLQSGTRLSSVKGFTSPHSVLVRAKADEILVTDSGKQASALLQQSTLKKLRNVNLALGANCILLDHTGNRLFVTAGGDRVSQPDSTLQIINPDSGVVLRTVRVPALHLQPMALDAEHKRLFVNIADQDAIGVFNSDTLERTGTWPIPKGHKNSPIAFDRESQSLFVIASDPGILMELDAVSGALRTFVPTPSNPDDLGFDPKSRRLFVPGDGALNVYQIGPASSLHPIQHLETGTEARTGIFLPDINAYAVAVPATAAQPAKVLLFKKEQ